MDQTPMRCWAEVNLDALAANYKEIRKAAGAAQIMAVVKADAYGHGDTVVAPFFDKLGADWFAVSCLAEARRLRVMGIEKPVLILGYTAPGYARDLCEMNLTQSITDADYAAALESCAAEEGCTVQGHLALDTGMGRIGFAVRTQFDTAISQMLAACAAPHLNITGAFTHFSVADSTLPENLNYTLSQRETFDRALQALRAGGITLRTVHCCNSAALLMGQPGCYDLVRPGIIQYGLQPSPEMAFACTALQPVLCLKATVAMVKTVPQGETISYGRTFCAPREMRIATVTAGYADGFPRTVSNQAVCSIHGHAVPQIGTICMDQLMVDVSGVENVQPGDTVTLFGAEAADTIDTLAEKAGTINYALICDLSRRVPRLYLENGREVARVDYMTL